MIQRYFLATGVMTLSQHTPVIDALFGGFNLQPRRPGGDVSATVTAPTWHGVFRALGSLAQSLSIDPPGGGFDSMQSALLALARHFGTADESELLDLIESHRFLSNADADLDSLCVIARHLNDGHGLESIKFNAGPHSGDLAHSAAHLANQMLDLLIDVLLMVPDEATLNPLRERLAALLVDAAKRMNQEHAARQG